MAEFHPLPGVSWLQGAKCELAQIWLPDLGHVLKQHGLRITDCCVRQSNYGEHEWNIGAGRVDCICDISCLRLKKKKKRFPVTQNSQRCSTSVEYMNGFLLLNTCFCCFKGLNILFQRRNKVKHSSSCTIICLFFCLSGILNVLAQEMLSFLQFYSLFPFEMLFVHCNTENIWNVACLYIQIKYQIYQWGKYYLTVPVFPFFLPSL